MPIAKAYHPLGYPICVEEDCEEPPHARGLCHRHYRHLRKQEREQGVPPETTRGSKVGSAVLDEQKVREIRQRHEAGEPQYLLAAIFGVSRHSISNVINRHTWSHVE